MKEQTDEEQSASIGKFIIAIVLVFVFAYLVTFVFLEVFEHKDYKYGRELCEDEGLEYFEVTRNNPSIGNKYILEITCFDTTKQENVKFERLF